MRDLVKPRGQPQKYPWQRWIPTALVEGSQRSKTLTLVRGKDFKCQPHGLAQMIRNRVSRRGYPLDVSIQVGEKSLVVTFERKS